jgi:exodeoxyribonuclease V gamma subunit
VARAGGIRPEHRIRAWVQHVAMCAAREHGTTGLPDTTLLIGRDGKPEAIGPVANASAVLDGLVAELAGARCAPLPFFAQAGWAWFDAVRAARKRPRRSAAPKDPIAAARAAYAKRGGEFGSLGGDGEDAYVALCFRGKDPMDSRLGEFERLASLLFSAWPEPDGDA